VQEIVGAMRTLEPRALGLSIVFPPDDGALRRDLRKLRGLLPERIPILIGGRAAEPYGDLLREIKAIRVDNLEELYPVLDKLQRTRKPAMKPRAK